MTGTRAVVGSIATLLFLAGCSQSDSGEDSTSASSAATSAEAADSPCSLLTPETVQDLAGVPLDGSESTVSGSDIPVCRYGVLADVGVQVARVPAEQWAKSLPGAVASLRSMPPGSVDPANMEQLENAAKLIEEGQTIPAAEACGYFSRLLEVQKQPPGSNRIVTYVPNRTTPETVNGQQCIDGRYVTLSVGRPEVGQMPELDQKVVGVLDQLK
jgi:hypothetical protein